MDHLPGALMGELIFAIAEEQVAHLSDGDRYYYGERPPAVSVGSVNSRILVGHGVRRLDGR